MCLDIQYVCQATPAVQIAGLTKSNDFKINAFRGNYISYLLGTSASKIQTRVVILICRKSAAHSPYGVDYVFFHFLIFLIWDRCLIIQSSIRMFNVAIWIKVLRLHVFRVNYLAYMIKCC